MASAAATVKRLTLELGGNDAGIVLPKTDVTKLVERLFWGAFINNGQTCAALKRLYVHDSVYEEVCDALVGFAGGVSVGDGLDEKSLLGPVQNARQRARVGALVDEARTAGGRILVGGRTPDGPGYFYPVTLVADVEEGIRLVDEEQFGPALPIIRYHDVDDAVRRANHGPFGLGASVWTDDLEEGRYFAPRLDAGSVWVNQHGAIRPDIPFGGIKQSGFGVQFGIEGLKEVTSLQAVYCG